MYSRRGPQKSGQMALNGFERAHDAGSDQMPFLGRGGAKQVEADRKFHVGWIEIRHVLDAVAGNVVENVIRQVAVRVYDADAMTGGYVLKNQVAEQGRLARAAFPDCVEVMPAVARGQNKGGFPPPFFPNP